MKPMASSALARSPCDAWMSLLQRSVAQPPGHTPNFTGKPVRRGESPADPVADRGKRYRENPCARHGMRRTLPSPRPLLACDAERDGAEKAKAWSRFDIEGMGAAVQGLPGPSNLRLPDVGSATIMRLTI